MLDALNFVKGAVSKKDLIPSLTHFRIAGGRITGFNGKLTLSAPIALDVDCNPKAVPMVRALEACKDTIQLHMTPSGKLAIRSGKFKAHIESLPEVMFAEVEPQGFFVVVENGGLLQAFNSLFPILADDASRPWSNGVLLDGESAFATNNVVLGEFRLGCRFPYRINVPRYAIKEMLRIGEEPVCLQLDQNSITFHYDGNRWLRSQLVSVPWPDARALFAKLPVGPLPLIPEGFWEAMQTVAPFLDEYNRVFFDDITVATATAEGASVELDAPVGDGIYNHKMFSLLEGVATNIDFSPYPAPLPWYGDNTRGLIIGMRS